MEHAVGPVETWERLSGAAFAPLGQYRRREPEKTLLHEVVRGRLEAFLAAARERSATGRGLPAFVERDFRAYLDCGISSRSGTSPPAGPGEREESTRRRGSALSPRAGERNADDALVRAVFARAGACVMGRRMFVAGGLGEALRRAREATGGLDVRVCGGADVIQQCLRARVVDERRVHVAPVLLGAGVRLFEKPPGLVTVHHPWQAAAE